MTPTPFEDFESDPDFPGLTPTGRELIRIEATTIFLDMKYTIAFRDESACKEIEAFIEMKEFAYMCKCACFDVEDTRRRFRLWLKKTEEKGFNLPGPGRGKKKRVVE